DLRNDVARRFQRLETFDARKILRNDLNDLDARQLFLQSPSNAGDRSSGADAGHEMRQLAVRLDENLGSCVVVVREPVIFVRILVAMKESIGLAIRDAMPFAQGFVVSF